jgi:hypothetical protein
LSIINYWAKSEIGRNCPSKSFQKNFECGESRPSLVY